MGVGVGVGVGVGGRVLGGVFGSTCDDVVALFFEDAHHARDDAHGDELFLGAAVALRVEWGGVKWGEVG